MLRLRVCAVGLLLVGLVVGCDSDTARPVRLGGVQVDGNELRYWLGTYCDTVTSVSVELTLDRADAADEELDTWAVAADVSETVGTLTLGTVPEGFREVDPLEADWRDADVARWTFTFDDADTLQVIDLRTVRDEAPDHEGEWYVTDLAEITDGDTDAGWYDEDGYADLLVPDEGITPMCDS